MSAHSFGRFCRFFVILGVNVRALVCEEAIEFVVLTLRQSQPFWTLVRSQCGKYAHKFKLA